LTLVTVRLSASAGMSATADTPAATGKRARAGMPATARFQQGNQQQQEQGGTEGTAGILVREQE
jgi:hypothetical protein